MVVFLIISLIFPISYLGAYKLINYADTSIFERYATNDRFDVNIFFNDEVEEKTAIVEQMRKSLSGFSDINRTQDFARIIYDNKENVETIILQNEQYQQYLNSVEVEIEDLFMWSRKVITTLTMLTV